MSERFFLGVSRYMVPLPTPVWQRLIRANGRKVRAGLGFMTADHHRIRNLVVLELPRLGAPIPPAWIADRLDLPLDRVISVLDELEKHLTFLFRNEAGAVSWAYPVTVDETPHRARFSTGEEAYSP